MQSHLRRTLSFAALGAVSTLAHAQTWQTVASFPASASPRQLASALEIDGTLWIVGGTPLTSGGDAPVHKYFPASNTIAATATPLEGGALNGGVALDALGRILVFSGVDSGGGQGDYYQWTEADGNNGGFASRSSQAPKTYFAIAYDDEGGVYSLGGGPGASATPSNQNKGRVERYDATLDAWQVRAPLPTPVADAAACNDGNGHILVIGGFGATGARTANVALYDIANNTWSDTAIADLPLALSGARAVLGVDQRVYVIGGTDGTTRRTTWILDSGATSWRAGPDLNVARHRAACVLGADESIYVFGGSNDAGGTGTNEKLATPRCPQVDIQASSLHAILGQPIGMSISVSGTPPFTYHWRHDGVDLFDGVQSSGSTVAGATTATLGLLNTTSADAGAYECVISNACGSTTSAAASVTLRGAPQLPTSFGSRSLHPAGAQSSHAFAIDGGAIAGDGLYPTPGFNPQYRPLVWDTQRVVTDLTPANSIGGSINAMRSGTKVGWYWWPVWTPLGTGYYQHACAWSASGALSDLQPQGWETGSILNTDGVHHVGWAFYDVDHSIAVDGVYWASSTPFDYVMLTTGGDYGVSGANIGALEGDRLFGVKFGTSPYDATMWRPGPDNVWQTTDIAPPGTFGSFIAGADSGQQVGRYNFPYNTQAGLWGGTSNSFVPLTPAGATTAEALETRHGLQVGSANFPGGFAHAVLWRGSAASALDLHSFSPAGFTTDVANDLEIDAFGTVTVVGHGSNSITGRVEALEWRGNPRALSTDAIELSAQHGCTLRFTLFGGPQNAGRSWTLLSAPRRALGPHGYSASLAPISGWLDETGFANVEIDVPAGVITVPIKVVSRFVVRAPNGAIVLTSNPVEILIRP